MATPVDFDYDGPPVNVSNGMAMQLVTQFGVRNAWFAFLKLRGTKTDNQRQEEENQSFAYFRNKIGDLRRRAKEFGDDGDGDSGLNILMNEDFDNFLASSDTLELRGDAPRYDEVDEAELIDGDPNEISGMATASPTMASVLEVIEQSKKRLKLAHVNNPDKNMIDSNGANVKEKLPPSSSESGKVKSRNNREVKEDDPGTKQVVEKLLAAKEEIARRHAETIDDVVSLVMEKIRNNQPFEGELVGPTGHSGPPKSHHKRVGGSGAIQRTSKGTQQRGEEVGTEIAQGQSQFSLGSTGIPAMTTTPANSFSHLSPGQSIVLLHNPTTGTIQLPSYTIAPSGKLYPEANVHHQSHPQQQLSSDQITFIGGQFPSERSSTAITTHSMSSTQSKNGGSGMATHQQQHQMIQQQQQQVGPFVEEGITTTIPIEMAIQQNMTVQELIQTLKTQSRHQNAQIIVQHNPIPSSASSSGHLFQPQQETPDSSSQEASMQEAQKLTIGKQTDIRGIGSTSNKKGRKRREGREAGDKKGSDQPATKQKTMMVEEGGEMVNGKEEEPKSQEIISREKKKQTTKGRKAAFIEENKERQHQSTIKTASNDKKQHQQQQQRVEELESQLRKTDKQLTTEKNKSTAQKKRADKLQSELDKALDSIQLLQIDLACQKTDNNNLIAENIALKAENQQLRSKGHRLTAVTNTSSLNAPISTPTTSSQSVGRGRKRKSEVGAVEEVLAPKAKNGRGRPLKPGTEPASNPLPPEKAQSPPPYTLSSELGRRQSKRICVARNQFMKNLF